MGLDFRIGTKTMKITVYSDKCFKGFLQFTPLESTVPFSAWSTPVLRLTLLTIKCIGNGLKFVFDNRFLRFITKASSTVNTSQICSRDLNRINVVSYLVKWSRVFKEGQHLGSWVQIIPRWYADNINLQLIALFYRRPRTFCHLVGRNTTLWLQHGWVSPYTIITQQYHWWHGPLCEPELQSLWLETGMKAFFTASLNRQPLPM